MLMKRRNAWQLSEQLRDMQTLTRDAARMAVGRDKPRADVLRQLDRPSAKLRERTAPLIVSLSILASWEATSGAVRVLTGDAMGWSQLRLGFLYRGWSLRCRYAMVDREKCNRTYTYSPVLIDQEPHCLAEAIAIGDIPFAHGFGQKLIANFQADGKGGPMHFYCTPLAPFVLGLYARWIGTHIIFREDVARPMGGYQALFDHWEDPGGFALALSRACDYHCEQCFGKPDACADFMWFPYNVYPVEILAIQQIRRELGLPYVFITHRLLDSPLAATPENTAAKDDELLERITARARADFPEIGDPW